MNDKLIQKINPNIKKNIGKSEFTGRHPERNEHIRVGQQGIEHKKQRGKHTHNSTKYENIHTKVG